MNKKFSVIEIIQITIPDRDNHIQGFPFYEELLDMVDIGNIVVKSNNQCTQNKIIWITI